MKNTTKMWDDYYSTLNTEAYSRPPKSYYDFPTVNRMVVKVLTDDLHIVHHPVGFLHHLVPITTMVELGCGGANVSLTLIGETLVDKVVLVDFSNKIKSYIEKVIDHTGYNIEFKKSDVLKFKTKEKFDIVYSGGLLDHFDGKDIDKAFKKHVSLCKPGGYVVTVVPYNSRFMTFVKTMKGIPESKLNYKLFEHQEMQDLFRKNQLDVIYHARHAVSIRPHIANSRPLEERFQNWPLYLIHNLGSLWKVYEFLEREFPRLYDWRSFFVAVSDCVLCYGMMHGDYLITVGKKR